MKLLQYGRKQVKNPMLSEQQKMALRSIPPVHELLQSPELQRLADHISSDKMTSAIQEVLSNIRGRIVNEGMELTQDTIITAIINELNNMTNKKMRKVINATGTVLHTNLGRAVLSKEACEAMNAIAQGYSNLEYDLDAGERGSRHDIIEDVICRLTGAEAAMVVNNNAAAVFLILRELGRGREVIVSRGQLVEIGGSFRVYEIMKESGATLVEVGTTNKTHLHDYEQAINEQTGLIMKVHTSNFKMIGFTAEVPIEALVALGHKRHVPVYEDLGSGVLYNLTEAGIGNEPTVQESIATGADLVSFSGDKLLGGPQAGIIAGKRQWIQRLKKNQLARVLRVDKMTLAALESTLMAYLHPEQAAATIPTLQMLMKPETVLREEAEHLANLIRPLIRDEAQLEVVQGESEVGGGSLPGTMLPTWLVCLKTTRLTASQIERALRIGTPSIIARIHKDNIYLDPRTLLPGDAEDIHDKLHHLIHAERDSTIR